MLDVDGNVISSEELVRRVEQHVTTIGPTSARSRDGAVGQRTAAPTALNEAPLRGLWALQARTRPPDLGQPKGLKGRASKFAKRIVRKLTHWYVEPRWTVQQAYNLQNAEFASSVLAELRLQNARFELQAASFANNGALPWQDRAGFAMQDDVQLLRQEVAIILERLGRPPGPGPTSTTRNSRTGSADRATSCANPRRTTSRCSLPPREPDVSSTSVVAAGRWWSCWREGHEVLGIDLDAGMVESCASKGLPVVLEDGIHFLSQIARPIL